MPSIARLPTDSRSPPFPVWSTEHSVACVTTSPKRPSSDSLSEQDTAAQDASAQPEARRGFEPAATKPRSDRIPASRPERSRRRDGATDAQDASAQPDARRGFEPEAAKPRSDRSPASRPERSRRRDGATDAQDASAQPDARRGFEPEAAKPRSDRSPAARPERSRRRDGQPTRRMRAPSPTHEGDSSPKRRSREATEALPPGQSVAEGETVNRRAGCRMRAQPDARRGFEPEAAKPRSDRSPAARPERSRRRDGQPTRRMRAPSPTHEGDSSPKRRSREATESLPPGQSVAEGEEMAGRQGFEPRFHGPEPRVLPLNDLPATARRT